MLQRVLLTHIAAEQTKQTIDHDLCNPYKITTLQCWLLADDKMHLQLFFAVFIAFGIAFASTQDVKMQLLQSCRNAIKNVGSEQCNNGTITQIKTTCGVLVERLPQRVKSMVTNLDCSKVKIFKTIARFL